MGAVRRELSVDMFGLKLSTPLFMAPIGVLGLSAQDGHGDLAAARAAAHTGIPMVASTLSVDPLEEVAGEFGETPGFTAPTMAVAKPTAVLPRWTRSQPW